MTSSLELEYVSPAELTSQPAAWWSTVLGVVGFEGAPGIDDTPVPLAASMTPGLGGEPLCEVWRVPGWGRPDADRDAPAAGKHGLIHYRCSGGFLFGSIRLFEGAGDGAEPLRTATLTAYREIFSVLDATGYPHLVRIWNYLPQINDHADGDERYRHFNAARQAAFRQSGRGTEGPVPAACALGSPPGSPLSIYFLAARSAPRMIENPRQVSAYHYPAEYGAHSPTFSRACLLPGSQGTTLFISGTASIVGHQTRHRGDVIAQTRETLANLAAVIDEANRLVGTPRYCLEGLRLKVYLRREADFEVVDAAVSRHAGRTWPVVYLKADVCRRDLLVEIEATGAAA